MADVFHAEHEQLIGKLFYTTCQILEMPDFTWRPLRRRVRGRGRLRSYALGYTKLGQKLITLDLYTPRTMKPRKIDAVLRIICHELAHHQAPPVIIRRWFRIRRLIHHPAFWMQYRKNVERVQAHAALSTFFTPSCNGGSSTLF